MTGRLSRPALALGVMLGVAGCHTVAGAAPRRAVLVAYDPTAREAITCVLLPVSRQGRVSFGQSDLSKEPLIVVQPPPPAPYEGNSPAVPVYYDLVTDGKRCFLLERGTDKTHALPGVGCRPK
ncbi:MAG: hypothetical protein ACKO7G_05740 [Gammaproteobacteria bacterium]